MSQESVGGDEAPKRLGFDYSPKIFKCAIFRFERPVEVDAISVLASKDNFEEKREFHITLLADDLFERSEKKDCDVLADRLYELCLSYPIVLSEVAYMISDPKEIEANGEVTKHERKSIVIPLDEESDLVQAVRRAYLDSGFKEEDVPFLHVTAFTYPANDDIARWGIGISSNAQWDNLQPTLFASGPGR